MREVTVTFNLDKTTKGTVVYKGGDGQFDSLYIKKGNGNPFGDGDFPTSFTAVLTVN